MKKYPPKGKGEIKTFLDKPKREHLLPVSALEEMLKAVPKETGEGVKGAENKWRYKHVGKSK